MSLNWINALNERSETLADTDYETDSEEEQNYTKYINRISSSLDNLFAI